jgi:hypothetical protein
VVINDLDFISVAVFPPKADAPLIVDANAMLARAIAFELLEAIAGRNPEVIEPFRRVDRDELTEHGPHELRRIATDVLALEEGFGVAVGEALDHPES